MSDKRMDAHMEWCRLNRSPSERHCNCGFDMNLPAGKTCGDCMYFRGCESLFGCEALSERCDYSPSRFEAP